jgi:hypothetical protein
MPVLKLSRRTVYMLPRYFLKKTEGNHEHVMHLQAKHSTLVYPTFHYYMQHYSNQRMTSPPIFVQQID